MSYDDVSNIKKNIKNDERLHQYQTAYDILMEYFDYLPDEDKPKIHKRLKEIGL